jgi:hypothetical protein
MEDPLAIIIKPVSLNDAGEISWVLSMSMK